MLVSLLIHLVLLVSVVKQFPVQLEIPAATIHVVMNRARHVEPLKQDAEPVALPPAVPVKQPLPVVRSASAEQAVVQGQLPAAPAEAQTQPLPRAAARSAAAAGNGLSPVAPAREGVSADDLRQYRLSLATAARRFKRYPALARERGWEGTVDVALNFSSLLPVPETVLVRSSGRSLLDEQALEMIAQAARVTSLPEGMKGRDFRVLIPVKFSLEGDQ